MAQKQKQKPSTSAAAINEIHEEVEAEQLPYNIIDRLEVL